MTWRAQRYKIGWIIPVAVVGIILDMVDVIGTSALLRVLFPADATPVMIPREDIVAG